MHATRKRRPSLPRTAVSVSNALSPIKSAASWNCTSPSSTTNRVGRSARPTTTAASTPVRFSSTARKLELSESPIIPVNGDLAATANLLEVVSRLPTSGTASEHERILRPQRVRARRTMLVQQPTSQPRPANELPQNVRPQRLAPSPPSRQINHQDRPMIPVHFQPPFNLCVFAPSRLCVKNMDYPPAWLENTNTLSPSFRQTRASPMNIAPFKLAV